MVQKKISLPFVGDVQLKGFQHPAYTSATFITKAFSSKSDNLNKELMAF